MVEEDNTELYQKALRLKGEIIQIDIAIEELAELTQALIKYKRNEGLYTKSTLIGKITEEIADVEIMLEQLIVTFDIKKGQKLIKENKINRLKERLKKIESEE